MVMDKIIKIGKYIAAHEDSFRMHYTKKDVENLIDEIWLKFNNSQLDEIGETFFVEEVSYQNGNKKIRKFYFELIEIEYITDNETGEQDVETACYKIKYLCP